MQNKDIIKAYIEIRKTNNTIPDEVLEFMKYAAIEKLNKLSAEQDHKDQMDAEGEYIEQDEKIK